jgi:4-amino-4-deoxy-L-arabinose transferase-like glycosyltransferase
VAERQAARHGAILALLVLLGAALRIFRLGELPLLGDESYYWLWSRHLDWAFFDHPAGVAVQTWFSTALGGQGEIGIRWMNGLLGLSCIPLAYLVGKRLFSVQAGLVTACAVAVGAPFVLISRFVYTDALQLVLMLANLYSFWRLAENETQVSLAWALAFGLSLAMLVNTKYSAYLYALGMGMAVILDHRWLLARRRFWLGCLIAALGLLPVLVWNANRGWVSFRWQLQHAGLSLSGDAGLLGRAYHALVYLTWPVVVLAVLGLGRFRTKQERLLGWVAACLLLPVGLSGADSPRNLIAGLVSLLLLAGCRWPSLLRKSRQRWGAGAMAFLLALLAFYGFGTVASLHGAARWLHSSAVAAIRQDAAGWREFGPELAQKPQPLFAVDYSLASQAWYYGGQPVHTSWGQYRLWGIPDLSQATVMSLGYLPDRLLTARLKALYGEVDGPLYLRATGVDQDKRLSLWQVRDLQAGQDKVLDQLDFLSLWRAAQ